MADEAYMLEWKNEDCETMNVADSAFTKGAFMSLSADPRTVSALGTALQGAFWGVLMHDKAVGENTVVSVCRGGIADMVSAGTATVGDWAIPSGTANQIRSADANGFVAASLSLGFWRSLIGMYMETASTSERVMVSLTRIKG